MKKTVAVLLVSAVALSAVGCSSIPQLPSLPNLPFGAKSKVSPKKLMEVCEEYDSEQYDDADEIASDLDNNRALLAGMYTYAEGKDCRTQLNNEDINELYSDVSDELFSNIYWKKITSSTMFIQVFSDEEGEIKLSAVAMEFGSSDDAEDYYAMKTEYFATLHEDDDSYECSTDEDLDGSLEYTVTTVYRGQSAECFATYIDKDCVMVLTGYEHKRNDATEYLQEICEIFGIPSPDITEWDCNSQPEIPAYVTGDVEDRFMAAVEYLHASEVDASSGMRASALDGAHYFLTQDRGSMSQFASGMGSTSGYELNELGILYDIGTGGGMTTVTMYRFADADMASQYYDSYTSSMGSSPITSSSFGNAQVEGPGEVNGIKFFKIDMSISSMGMLNGYYCEGDRVYTITVMSSGNSSQIDTLLSVMGLP